MVVEDIPQTLLVWYDRHARMLPWRTPPGSTEGPDPYRVWLSEIMLQQTTVAAVIPYFQAFTRRWPTVESLASAADEDVMTAWAGLGYYSRARNLLACARVLASANGKEFPTEAADLRQLPGIGEYTSAAIAAIAFDKQETVVDGNVERVVARLFKVEIPLPRAKPELRRLAALLTPPSRPGDFAQAMMDLGATVCTPRAPRCLTCPLTAHCKAYAAGDPERLPLRLPKSARPERIGTAFWLERDGEVLLVRRPAKGLLGGMRALPSSEWGASGILPANNAPASIEWRTAGQQVKHVFTHFALSLDVAIGALPQNAAPAIDGEWWPIQELATAGLPTVFAKAARIAMESRPVPDHKIG